MSFLQLPLIQTPSIYEGEYGLLLVTWCEVQSIDIYIGVRLKRVKQHTKPQFFTTSPLLSFSFVAEHNLGNFRWEAFTIKLSGQIILCGLKA